MISAFRKIRRQLMSQNRFSKYLLYAIGEIVLVVVGILLALQINSWNQDRLDRKAEKSISSELAMEFQKNADLIQERLSEIRVSTKACIEIMNIMENEVLTDQPRQLDSLLYLTIEYSNFNPSTNTLEEIYQVGNFSILTNKELKNALFEWSRELQNYTDIYDIYEKYIEEVILPYYTEHIALKNVDKYSPMAWKKDSRFDSGYDYIFNDRSFESLIDNNLYHLARLEEHYQTLDGIVKIILEETQ